MKGDEDLNHRHIPRKKQRGSGISLGEKGAFTLERPSADGCKTRRAYERIDFTVIMPFALRVGPRAGLQAVCIRVLAHLHRVLARRLAYSHRVLVHKGPCLQAERMSFASRYMYAAARISAARTDWHIVRLGGPVTIRQSPNRLFVPFYSRYINMEDRLSYHCRGRSVIRMMYSVNIWLQKSRRAWNYLLAALSPKSNCDVGRSFTSPLNRAIKASGCLRRKLTRLSLS
jgi:hypothetical protein